ncbi:MAG TPA: hypothetical protein VHU40_18095, partial [Polyangia bacterium]|nr:hypothetical protein [Polyangia bacterium]
MNQATSRAKGNSEITITTLLLGPLLLASACVPGANPPPSVTDPGPGFGSGGSFGGPQPVFESPITAAVPPPAITGGTLLALADGRTAVAADPDRDKIFVVDYKAA